MSDNRDSMDHESNNTKRLSNQHWRLSKEVSIATLLALAGAGTTGVWHIAELRNEQQVMKVEQQSLRERVERSEAASDRTIVRIEGTVLRIEQRVNALLEKK